jgi:hypothetical protein
MTVAHFWLWHFSDVARHVRLVCFLGKAGLPLTGYTPRADDPAQYARGCAFPNSESLVSIGQFFEISDVSG